MTETHVLLGRFDTQVTVLKATLIKYRRQSKARLDCLYFDEFRRFRPFYRPFDLI